MYIDKNHSQLLLKNLSLLRQNEQLCDVELKTGETSVFAHKVVLAAVSDYFKVMFTGEMEESIVRTIYLHDIDEKCVSLLVDFAYTGHLNLSVNNVQSLLVTANMLSVSKIVSACCEFLEKQLHASNCLGFLEFADRHSLSTLKRSCLQFSFVNFHDLRQYDEYLFLSTDILKQLLSSDYLHINNEEEVFLFLEQWVLYDQDKRIKLFYDLLSVIRFSHLDMKFISYLKTHYFVTCTLGYQLQLKLQSTLNMKMNPFRLLDEDLEDDKLQRNSSNHIFVTCGKDGFLHPLDSCSIYDVDKNLWKICKSLSLPRLDTSASSINGQVYLIGGMSCSSSQTTRHIKNCTTSVLQYSVKFDEWHLKAEMNHRRSSHVATHHGGLIYAIGGYDGKKHLKSAECYNPKLDKWTDIVDMKYCRSSFAAVTLEEYIYVLGGQGEGNLCTVERYDTKSAQWELMPAMSTKRIKFGAAQVHGFIYAVGGHDGLKYLRSMERFDPISSEWTVVTPMFSPRSGIGVAVVKNKMYVLGGHDGSRYLNSSYRYDPCKDVWTEVCEMVNARCYMAISDVLA